MEIKGSSLNSLQAERPGEAGATMVEYALMVILLAVALLAAIGALKTSVSSSFSRTGSAVLIN